MIVFRTPAVWVVFIVEYLYKRHASLIWHRVHKYDTCTIVHEECHVVGVHEECYVVDVHEGFILLF